MTNQDKSAVRVSCQVAAWVPDMFCNFDLVNSYKIATNSATIEDRIKISTDSESLEFFMHVWLNLKTTRFYLIKISHRFQVQPSYLDGKKTSLFA
jgi:hypothetical protein